MGDLTDTPVGEQDLKGGMVLVLIQTSVRAQKEDFVHNRGFHGEQVMRGSRDGWNRLISLEGMNSVVIVEPPLEIELIIR